MVIAGEWPTARRGERRRSMTMGALLGLWLRLERNARLSDVTAPAQTPATAAPDGESQSLPTFEAFFRRHEREVFGYLWRMTGDEQTAYDLSQESFVRAWQHFDRITTYDRPAAWLFRVATNLALTHQKRAAAPVGAAQSLSTGADPSVSDPAWHLAESDAVRETLLTLPAQQRAALVLREVYGFSCAEVAETLGITLAAAKMTLSRSRDTFRARYTRQEERA